MLALCVTRMLGLRSEASTRWIKRRDPVFEISGNQVIAERCRLCFQDGLDLAHHREDMKPGAEGAGGLDRREQGFAAGGFIIEVNREQNVLVHVILTPTV